MTAPPPLPDLLGLVPAQSVFGADLQRRRNNLSAGPSSVASFPPEFFLHSFSLPSVMYPFIKKTNFSSSNMPNPIPPPPLFLITSFLLLVLGSDRIDDGFSFSVVVLVQRLRYLEKASTLLPPPRC